MKKLFIFLIMCVNGLALQAQVTELPEGFTSKSTVWIVRAGANFSGVSGDGVDATKDSWEKGKWTGDFKRAFGGNLSIGFNKAIGSTPLYWGMDLGVAMRGYKTKSDWSSYGTQTVAKTTITDSHVKSQTQTLNAYNVILSPITIGYRYIINGKMAVDAHVGGFASYDFAGSFDTDIYDFSQSRSSKYGYSSKDKSSDSSVKIGDIDGYRRYDFGVIGGIGFWYGHFNIDFSYQRGFVSILDSDDGLFCNKLQVKLGYAF